MSVRLLHKAFSEQLPLPPRRNSFESRLGATEKKRAFRLTLSLLYDTLRVASKPIGRMSRPRGKETDRQEKFHGINWSSRKFRLESDFLFHLRLLSLSFLFGLFPGNWYTHMFYFNLLFFFWFLVFIALCTFVRFICFWRSAAIIVRLQRKFFIIYSTVYFG